MAESTQALAICDARAAGQPVSHVNPEFARLTGWELNQATGKPLAQLLRPPGGQFEWDRLHSVMQETTSWRKTLPAARRDGTVFWADVHLYPLSGDEDVVTHWVAMISDVTENLEVHDALHQSEAQLRLLAENIRDLITVCRAGGDCSFASPSSRSLLGYEPSELIGMPLQNFVHPDDRSRMEQHLNRLFTEGGESTIVHRMRRKEGTFVWAETTSKTHADAKTRRPSEVISSTRDITKRRQAEENLRAMHSLLDTVHDAVPIGLALLDTSGKFMQCNRAFAQVFALSSSQIAGRAADSLIPPTDLVRATIAQGSVCACDCTDANGETVPTELTVVPLTSTGEAERLVILADLRDRRKMETRLREASHLESLGTLAGGIAHDFNNMLAIILGYASLLRDSASDPARITHYADTIIDAGRRGADVVRQLQLFANNQDAELAPTNIHAMLDETTDLVCAEWPKNIEIEKIYGATDSGLTADHHQLIQAFQKLLENAREAMPDGGRLVIRTSEVRQAFFSPGSTAAEQKTFLRISIQDTGHGMDAATRARMFEPFFARNRNPEMRGLGLAVVYGIMRAHRGLIEVDSAPGQGTTVHLLFPRASVKTELTTTPFPENFDAAADRRTILLVEDEQDIGALWLEILPTDGWRVLWARDGGEAVRLFRAHRDEIALVFTDIGLPVLDGWQVAETIRREIPGMPLLIASGAFRSGDRQRGFADPVAYLSKPYVPTKVIKQIRGLVPGAS
ncbi:MAG TPA: PAS domain S-box protein [Opitutaceae bacterium]|nr:PAS domain S-box protein [Opitutaceae bacterium]